MKEQEPFDAIRGAPAHHTLQSSSKMLTWQRIQFFVNIRLSETLNMMKPEAARNIFPLQMLNIVTLTLAMNSGRHVYGYN